MKLLLTIIILYSINEISSYTLSGYKLRKDHLKYYLLNTPKNIDYSYINICHLQIKQSFAKLY